MTKLVKIETANKTLRLTRYTGNKEDKSVAEIDIDGHLPEQIMETIEEFRQNGFSDMNNDI